MIITAIIIIISDIYIDLRKSFANTFISTIIFINFYLKYVISSEITIYEKFEIINFLINLFNEYFKKRINAHFIKI